MPRKTRTGPTADQFVQQTLTLIEEKGGSQEVNLREVSRRVGCAHTNAYNYFSSFEELLWASYSKAIMLYEEYLLGDVDFSEFDFQAFRLVIERLAHFPLDHPGLYRFIGSDPLPIENMPGETLEAIGLLRGRFVDGVAELIQPTRSRTDAEEISHILIAYISGESFDLINGRLLPGDDLPGRIIRNALRIFGCMTGRTKPEIHQRPGEPPS